MINTIYLLKNKINNKVYIGQTWETLKRRWRNGLGYKKCTLINRAINKYGKENFYYEVITFCSDQETADILEDVFIKKYKSNNRKYGYNLKEGGSHGKFSEETKRKISKSAIERDQSGERNPNYGNHAIAGENHFFYGTHRSKETKQKISIANTGKKRTEETKQKMSEVHSGNKNSMFGKKHSKETLEKLRKPKSEEHKEKLRKPKSEEHKRNLVKAQQNKTWKLIDGKRIYGKKAA